MYRCPNCRQPLGNYLGSSSIYGSHDVGDLCGDCWEEEDVLILEEGTNCPEMSKAIAARLQHYRSL